MAFLEATRACPDHAPLPQPEIAAMGKTGPPCRPLIAGERRRWASCKRALPEGDQAIVDRLFDYAKRPVQAGGYASRPWAFESSMTAMLLEHEKWIERILKQFDGEQMR
jgi:hypothetical protein